MNSLDRRLTRLEKGMPRPPCQTCKGKALAIIWEGEKIPESPCPGCGREIQVITVTTRTDGPQ